MIARALLAAVFLSGTQLALVHPLAHLELERSAAATGMQDPHPVDPQEAQQCDVCVSVAPLGAAAPSAKPLQIQESPHAFAARATTSPHYAAFAPLYRSQAPPASL